MDFTDPTFIFFSIRDFNIPSQLVERNQPCSFNFTLGSWLYINENLTKYTLLKDPVLCHITNKAAKQQECTFVSLISIALNTCIHYVTKSLTVYRIMC